MVSEISWADGAKTWNFQLLNWCLDQRMLEVWPPQKWGFWCQMKIWGQKNIKGGPKKWRKLFFWKRATLIFYLKSYKASVNLMGTSCTGICLEHQLLIFWFTRRGVSDKVLAMIWHKLWITGGLKLKHPLRDIFQIKCKVKVKFFSNVKKKLCHILYHCALTTLLLEMQLHLKTKILSAWWNWR